MKYKVRGEAVSLGRTFLLKSKIKVQGESLSTLLLPANLCGAMSTTGGPQKKPGGSQVGSPDTWSLCPKVVSSLLMSSQAGVPLCHPSVSCPPYKGTCHKGHVSSPNWEVLGGRGSGDSCLIPAPDARPGEVPHICQKNEMRG